MVARLPCESVRNRFILKYMHNLNMFFCGVCIEFLFKMFTVTVINMGLGLVYL